ELRVDDTRVNGVGHHGRLPETPAQLKGKKNIGELRAPVGGPGLVAAFAAQVVKVDALAGSGAVRLAAHHDDSAVVGEGIETEARERKVSNVVREELALVAVDELELRERHDAGVIDDGVEGALRADLARGSFQRFEIDKISLDRDQLWERAAEGRD